MNSWLSKMFVSELVKGYKIDKDDKGFYAGTQKRWKVLRGIRSRDNLPISFFILDKQKLSKTTMISEVESFYQNEARNLLKIRHPSFLNVLESIVEEKNRIIFITQRVDFSLELFLQEKHVLSENVELKLNLLEILNGIDFLNNVLFHIHLNLSPENVFITPQG